MYVYSALSLAQPPWALHIGNSLLEDIRGAANTLVFVVEGKTQSVTTPPSTDWLQITAADNMP